MNNNNEQTDLLISLIVDGEATPQQWQRFSDSANANPQLWQELSHAQRDHALLCRAVQLHDELTDAVELPESNRQVSHTSAGRIWAPVVSWTGWAVAALLALAWIIGTLPGQATPSRNLAGNEPANANLVSIETPADALDAYMSRGREAGTVLGEVPTRVLLDARPDPSGQGYELLYLRQIIERAYAPDLYEVIGDDTPGDNAKTVRYERVPGAM